MSTTTPSLQDQINALSDELAQLQQQVQAGAADNIAPNYLSIDPTTGKVIANLPGLILPAASGPKAAAANSVQWQADGATVAQAGADYRQVSPPTGPEQYNARFGAQTPDGTTAAAALTLTAESNGYAEAAAAAGGAGVTIIDSLGASSFAFSGLGATAGSSQAAAWNTTSSTPHLVMTSSLNVKKNNASLLWIVGFSGYTTTVGSIVGVGIEMDSLGIAGLPGYYFNTASDHRDIGPRLYLSTGVSAGNHTVKLFLSAFFGQFQQDANDQVGMAVIELP